MMVGRKAGRQDLVPPVRVCVCVCGGEGGGGEAHQQVWIKPGNEKSGRGRGERGLRRGI